MSLFVDFFKVVTVLGDAIFVLVGSTFLYLNRRKLGLRAGLTILVAIYFANILKAIFKVPRPPQEYWLVQAGGYSFPSGHATDSAAFWGVIFLHYLGENGLISLLSIVIILLVGYSRVVLGVHFWSDVIAGWALGMFFALLTHFKGEEIASYYNGLKASQRILSISLLYVVSLILPLPIVLGDDVAFNSYEDSVQAISAFYGIVVGLEFARFRGIQFSDSRRASSFFIRGFIGVAILILPFLLYEILGNVMTAPFLFALIGFLLVTYVPLIASKVSGE